MTEQAGRLASGVRVMRTSPGDPLATQVGTVVGPVFSGDGTHVRVCWGGGVIEWAPWQTLDRLPRLDG